MHHYTRNALAALALVFLFSLAAATATGEGADLTVTALDYTNDFEVGEPVTLVESGKNDGTTYEYSIFDDDDDDCDVQRCLPDGWYDKNFDDSGWSSGAAPFGNYDLGSTAPGTFWQTEDGLNDYIIVRHHFTYEGEHDVLSATLNVAYNTYYTAYLNGNLIRSCGWGCGEGDAEYWNHQMTYDGSSGSGPNPDWLVEGDNVLAILGIDSTWGGGDGEQWLDAEFIINIQAWKDKPIVLGDDLWLRVSTSNLGNETAENFTVTLDVDGEELGNTTIPELAPNGTVESIFYWTPEALGDFTLIATADADGDVSESNEENNTLERTLHVGFYAWNASLDRIEASANMSETAVFALNVTNTGDVEDNFTISVAGVPNDWELALVPRVLHLQPGETATCEIRLTVGDLSRAGNYSFVPSITSQYHSEVTTTIVASGAAAATEYRYYISNATVFPNEYYEYGFNDTDWANGSAPFGHGSVDGIDAGTNWETTDINGSSGENDYISTRHWFNYTGDLDFTKLYLILAYDNYFRAYLNEQLIRNCLSYSGSCYRSDAEYWNMVLEIERDRLLAGDNLLAVAGRDSTYQGGNGEQWLDFELLAVKARYSAWNFTEPELGLVVEVLPYYNFTLWAPISNKEIPDDTNYTFEIWITNNGNVRDTFDLVVTNNDTRNFTILNHTTEVTAPYGGGGVAYLNVTMRDLIEEEARGGFNVTVTSRNSTEALSAWLELTAQLYVVPDTLRPVTEAQTEPLVNSTSFLVEWEVAEWYRLDEVLGNDTKAVTVEYRMDNGSGGWEEWQVWQVFTADDEDNPLGSGGAVFHMGADGRSFQFRSLGLDDDGLLEDKAGRNDTETLVDTTPPAVVVSSDPAGALLSTDYLELSWESNASDLAGYDLQHALDGGAWVTLLTDSLETRYDYYVTADGSHTFRVIASDDAGNRGVPVEPQISVLIDTAPPTGMLAPLESLTGALAVTLLPSQDDASSYNLSYARIAEEQLLTTIWAWQELGGWNTTQSHDFNVDDGYAYFFRYTPVDTAGNVADRGALTASYSGNGDPEQAFALPLPAIVQQGDPQLSVRAGLTELTRSDVPGMVLSSQYYYDAATATIEFGNGASGYLPGEGEAITIAWSGYDTATLVDRTPPTAPRSFQLTLAPDGSAQLRFLYSASEDVVEYRVIRKDSPNATGDLLATLAASEGYLTHVDQPPGEQLWIYHVVAVDRRGQLSPAVEATVDLTPAVQPPAGSGDEEGGDGIPTLILAGVAAAILGGGAAAWWFTRPSPVAATPVLTEVASPFTATGAELACDGCGTIFAPDGETLHCPGCGQVGPPPS